MATIDPKTIPRYVTSHMPDNIITGEGCLHPYVEDLLIKCPGIELREDDDLDAINRRVAEWYAARPPLDVIATEDANHPAWAVAVDITSAWIAECNRRSWYDMVGLECPSPARVVDGKLVLDVPARPQGDLPDIPSSDYPGEIDHNVWAATFMVYVKAHPKIITDQRALAAWFGHAMQAAAAGAQAVVDAHDR